MSGFRPVPTPADRRDARGSQHSIRRVVPHDRYPLLAVPTKALLALGISALNRSEHNRVARKREPQPTALQNLYGCATFGTDRVHPHRPYTRGHPELGLHKRQTLAIAVIGFALAYILVEKPFGTDKTVVQNIVVALTTTLAAISAFYFGSKRATDARNKPTLPAPPGRPTPSPQTTTPTTQPPTPESEPPTT
jgi:hypothetical protein